ncbi:MAG: amino acid ABC transporter permease [Lachnospiraceae bacterium]
MKSVDAFISALPKLISVLPSTVLLFIAIVILSILLGLVLAAIRISKHKIAGSLVAVFVSFIRGTPLLIQIMIVYFGLRAILINGFGIREASRLDAAYFAFIAYGLNIGGFLSETFRGAYLAIDRGQIEAAQSVGMTRMQVFRRVILPQGAQIALPGMGNLMLDGFKALSLAFSIGVIEMMGRGQGIVNATRGIGAIGTYAAVALVYWFICFLMDKLFLFIEKSLAKDLRSREETTQTSKRKFRKVRCKK